MKKNKNSEGEVPRSKRTYLWALRMALLTFLIAAVFAFVAVVISRGESFVLPIIILVILICLGCLFDIIGTAVASADIAPFVAMSSRKVRGAKECIFVLQNADKVSNICNDVIGDICGVVSGAAAASVVMLALAHIGQSHELWLSIFASALVSAVTVGSKAAGKSVAMKKSKEIVYMTGYVISFFRKQDKR